MPLKGYVLHDSRVGAGDLLGEWRRREGKSERPSRGGDMREAVRQTDSRVTDKREQEDRSIEGHVLKMCVLLSREWKASCWQVMT